MKNETAVIAAEKLLSVMAEMTETLNNLLAFANEQETLITSQDIEGLAALREKEEELISEMGRQEEERAEAAAALAYAVGVEKGANMDQLIANIGDLQYKSRLIVTKKTMAETVATLSKQNAKNGELLKYHINYTDYMINLLLVPRSKSNFYNVQGVRKDDSRNLNLLDFHI